MRKLGNVLLVILLFVVRIACAALRFVMYLIAPVAFLVGGFIYVLGFVCLIILGINGTPIGELVPAFLIIAVGGAIPLLHVHILNFLYFLSEKASLKIKTITRPQLLQD